MSEGSLPSILVLVLSNDREPWRRIEVEGQRATWAAPGALPTGVDVVFYYGRGGPVVAAARIAARLARAGGPAGRAARALVARMSARAVEAEPELVGDRLFTAVPDAYPFMLAKMLAALRWATSGAAGRFDYVYRANASAYVNLDAVRSAAAALPRTDCYAGWLGRPPEVGPPFVKGAGILLSWELASAVAGERCPWDWGLVDDVALGRYLAARGVQPVQLPRILVRRAEDLGRVSDEELRAAPYVRCKSRGPDRDDAVAMQAVHARLQGR